MIEFNTNIPGRHHLMNLSYYRSRYDFVNEQILYRIGSHKTPSMTKVKKKMSKYLIEP